MLEYLHIRNVALIEDMTLEFVPGINVLTGETGAGKSFILKALGFLLGDKFSADMVRGGADRAQVEALFSLPSEDLILRRELLADSGRSRLYINDTLRSQESLRDLRHKLISLTSQHAQQRLLQPAFQAYLLERGMQCDTLIARRQTLLTALQENADKRNALLERQSGLVEKRELLEMQQQEIDKVAPKEGEEELLEDLRNRMRSVEQLHKKYDLTLALLHGDDAQQGLIDQLSHFEKLLYDIQCVDDRINIDVDSVTALRQQMSSLTGMLRRPPALPDMDDVTDIDQIEERLFTLAHLKRKLHRTLPEILSLRAELADNLSFLDICALDLAQLEKEEKALKEELIAVTSHILPARRAAATATTAALEAELRQLGFSAAVRVIPEFSPYEIWPGVIDERGRILWAPNPGQPAQPLDKIASGGELSRFLLALAGIQNEDQCSTFIFDEVDAGVGGLTLNSLAEKLSALAASRQILLITHWPQLAVRASKHFQISKIVRDNATFTLCTPLDTPARHAELVRMAGGGSQGEALALELEKAYSR